MGYKNGHSNGHSREDRDDREGYGRFDRIERPQYVPPHIKAPIHEAAVKAIAAWDKYLADPTDANKAAALFAEHMNTVAMMKEDKPEKVEKPAAPVAQA